MPETLYVPGDSSLHLRHIQHADAEPLAQLVARNCDAFTPYLGWAAQITPEKMSARIESQLILSSQNEGMSYCILQGEPDQTETHLGLVRLFSPHPHWRTSGEFDLRDPVAFCGSWLDQNARGQGIMTHAKWALFAYAQQRWGTKNIFMDIAQDNIAAENAARTMGAISMNYSFWQMTRAHTDERQDVFNYWVASSTDMGFVWGRMAEQYRDRRARTVPMIRWLLRLV